MAIIIWIHGVSLQALAVSSSSRQQMHLLVIVPPHIAEGYSVTHCNANHTLESSFQQCIVSIVSTLDCALKTEYVA